MTAILLTISIVCLAYTWAISPRGLAVIERRFAQWMHPTLELIGREKELYRWYEISVFGILIGSAMGMVLGGIPMALLIALSAGFLPPLYLVRAGRKRVEMIERQLPSTLDALGSALRSGQSMVQAVAWVAREAPSPTSDEFRRLSREMALGRSLEEGLEAMSLRLPSPGLKSLAMTVGPLRSMGANMIPALEGMGDILRRRASTVEKMGSLTAQAKMQLWVMGLMLPVLMLILAAMEPKLIGRLLVDYRGQAFLLIAGLLQLLALIIARKILNPKNVFD